MRRLVGLFAAIALMTSAMVGQVRSALGDGDSRTSSGLELLVLQTSDCSICSLVQTHILPAYKLSPTSNVAPMRFVDINEIDETAIGLAQAVTIVPTMVLMRDGAEVGRITGYTGPESFFQAVARMVAGAG